jgi:hypothetical protein
MRSNRPWNSREAGMPSLDEITAIYGRFDEKEMKLASGDLGHRR